MRFLFLTLLLPVLLFGDAEPYYEASLPEPSKYPDLPWLTGPLITPGENVIPTGLWNVEPYFALNAQYAQYNNHWGVTSLSSNVYSFQQLTQYQYGLFKNFDFQITPQFSWKRTGSASQWTVGDVGVNLDFQLLHIQKGKWWPNIKFTIQGTVPVGKYQHLNPAKQGTDKGGKGSINPGAGITAGKITQFSEFHFLRMRGFAGYVIPNPVHVKGLNAYGGGKGTKGTVYPAQTFAGLIAFEYTFTPNWVLACDFQYLHTTKQRFKGHTIKSMKAPSSDQFSLAPAIEYNWNVKYGVISGLWFSVAGRNAPAFANWVTAANFYF